MDDIVKAAMAKWPTVPHCHGWLALDARGDWYMRDERTQAAGPFPHPKGSRVQHAKLLAFIERNYAHDETGAWYFQNGPQRVYLQLEAAPWVWRVAAANPGAVEGDGGFGVTSHTGLAAQVQSAWLDEAGRLFLHTDLGFGIVHSLDMDGAADAVASGQWQPQTLAFQDMPARFGYVLQPRAAAAAS